jgi:hypothetical protein
MFLRLIKEPILFQGRNKKDKYFEGWFFKQVSADLKNSICIIPGVSLDPHNPHAFIQTITNANDIKHETHYYSFSLKDFQYNDNPFILRIDKNVFNREGIYIDLSDESSFLCGKINFSPLTSIKTNRLFPNIMGYYAYLPFMECYHGIVSMNHTLIGSLKLNEKIIDFDLGKGYIEKDWGTSFPKEYIWFQCNNFEDSNVSIMCSIANIPFLGKSFQGFICNLVIRDKEYRFASYNYSKIIKSYYTEDTLVIKLKEKI